MLIAALPILPVRRLSLALLLCLFMGALALGLALHSPWLGLQLRAQEDGSILVVQANGPSRAIPVNARLVFLADDQIQLALSGKDLLEEPDVFDLYSEMDAFFARQGELAGLLRSSEVTLGWRADSNPEPLQTTRVRPVERPLHSLPLFFWFQLAVSSVGFLIAAWVWALRPQEWGVRLFAITGLSFPVFAMSAAVYSSRELALDGSLFKALSALNHWGSFMFGAALFGIFLCAPKRLVSLRVLLGVFVFYNLWWLADTLRWAPDMDWGNRFAVMSEMLLALVLAGVQWVRSRREPLDRAALRWFMLSLLLGSGLFILLMVTTASLGWLPPVPQGYAFGFFLFIYIGIALGLGHYRLFDLDVWAYRLLFWLVSALLLVGLDALFIGALQWSGAQALAVSLWACVLVYLPLRQWLWQRFGKRPKQRLDELLPDVVRIAFQTETQTRERLWADLLQRVYQPLEQVTQSPSESGVSQLTDEGLALLVPACAGISARLLRYPAQGARLFSPRDRNHVEALVHLMRLAESTRAAQELGAQEERQRIARDMHDDVGARLLMLMHHAKSPELVDLARAAMQDLRTALAALDSQPVLLAHALADWRAEASARCEAAGVALLWHSPAPGAQVVLTARQKAVMERTLRESLTNAFKHGQARQIEIRPTVQAGVLTVQISHDGPMTTPESWTEGRGLLGMKHRLQEVHGALCLTARSSGGTQTILQLPVET
ncbi:sensor histidine kinase [Rhodoferax sp.]|uniref:sensor histidine kinase n=1 Tax=Rhodoferax sp. TaxID=50421 RepID=UPI002717F8B0|nr:ATP-binding protein [Rhodoferax sp.]MDO8318159.1 histidine kinase [Rhodoferax sp.]